MKPRTIHEAITEGNYYAITHPAHGARAYYPAAETPREAMDFLMRNHPTTAWKGDLVIIHRVLPGSTIGFNILGDEAEGIL